MKFCLQDSSIHVRHWTGLVGEKKQNKKSATVEIQPFSRYPLGILKSLFKPQVGSIPMTNMNLSV